jgi:hypothetical protein
MFVQCATSKGGARRCTISAIPRECVWNCSEGEMDVVIVTPQLHVFAPGRGDKKEPNLWLAS